MVGVDKFVPERGDIIWLDFRPTKGREQTGNRPALVLSRKFYNQAGLIVVCPIATKIKGYNIEVTLREGGGIKGVVLTNQIHTKDWKVQNIKKIGEIHKDDFIEVLSNIKLVLGM